MKKTYAIFLAGMMVWIGVALPASAAGSRQMKITLDDMLRIHPDRITVKAGETVDFVVHNAGTLRHEFVIGDAKELDEHAKEMRDTSGTAMDGMPMKDSAKKSMREKEEGVEALDVKPGKTGHLLYHFKKPGELPFACLYPGHREAGMKGVIKID